MKIYSEPLYIWLPNTIAFEKSWFNTENSNLLAATAVLFILLIVFSVFLRIRQGDMYISIWDDLETMTTMLLPIDAKSKKEIMQLLDRIGDKEEIMATDLWFYHSLLHSKFKYRFLYTAV